MDKIGNSSSRRTEIPDSGIGSGSSSSSDGVSDDVTAILKSIAGFNKKTAKTTLNLVPDNIYCYEIRRENQCYGYLRLHGKCSADIDKYPQYTVLVTNRIDKDDFEKCRTTCTACGEPLNKSNIPKLLAEHKVRAAKRKTDWERKHQRELERQKELVLLGKL
jgi:hypothetical protein